MRLTGLALVAYGFASVALAQPATTTLTLDAAIARAMERSAFVVTAMAERQVADAQLQSASAWANPTLHVELENVLGKGSNADFDAAETTVSLAQELPIGGHRGALRRAARASQASASAGLQVAQLSVRRDVTIAYAEAIAADRLATIARSRASIAAETRRAVEQRYAAGLESELQNSRIAVETSGLQAAAQRAAAGALAARRRLAQYWRTDTVVEPLDDVWFDASSGATNGRAAVALGLDGTHPRVQQLQLATARAQAELDAVRAQRLSGLEATLGTRRFKDLPSDSNQAFVLGVSVPLPLWDRNRAGIASARAELMRMELELEQTGRDLAAQYQFAVAELGAATLEVQALAAALPAAESAARLSSQGYDAGRLSLLERLSAERALFDAREQLEGARLAAHRAQADLASLSQP